MAPLPPVPQTMTIQFHYSDTGDLNMVNTVYFNYNGTVSLADLNTWTPKLATSWTGHLAPVFDTAITLQEIITTDIASVTGARSAVTPSTGNKGTNAAGSGLTSGVAFVLGFQGGKRYRGGHSRIYLPGQSTGNLADANTWTAAWQQFVISAWSAFVTEIKGSIPVAFGSIAQAIAHRYGRTPAGPGGPPDSELPSVPLTNPTTEPVIAFVGNGGVGSQRRRNLNTL